MRLTLEPTVHESSLLPRALRPRVVIEIDCDDLPLAAMLDDLIKPALLALQYPAGLVQALDYGEAFVLSASDGEADEYKDRAYE